MNNQIPVDAIYKNRMYYYNLSKDFLEGKIKAWPYGRAFWNQRSCDIDRNKENGFSEYYQSYGYIGNENEQRFRKEYFNKLYNYTSEDDTDKILDEYVKGTKKYDIKGRLFFSGIYDDLSVDVKDFYPREGIKSGYTEMTEMEPVQWTDEEYVLQYHIDEDEFRAKVAKKMQILDDNKDRWM